MDIVITEAYEVSEKAEDYNPFPIVLLLFLLTYSCVIFIAFILVLNFCPARLKQKPTHFSVALPPTFLDCSFITLCCPCSDCSFRNLLKSLCPSKKMLDRWKESCNCTIQRPQSLDLVCCQV